MITKPQTWRLDDPELSSNARLLFTYFNHDDSELGCSVDEAELLAAVGDVYDIGHEEALQMVSDGVWEAIISSDVRKQLPQVAKELAAKSLRDPIHHLAAERDINIALNEGRLDYAHNYLRRLSHFACGTLVRDPTEHAGAQDTTLVEA